jgi:ATP-dependent Clp protease adapter protein ClpS
MLRVHYEGNALAMLPVHYEGNAQSTWVGLGSAYFGLMVRS